MKTSAAAWPREFVCEHAASKSRVLVVLSRKGFHDAVQAVLTCTDPDLAEQVTALLRFAASGGLPAAAVTAGVDRLAALLPAAVTASLRRAAGWATAGTWPVTASTMRPARGVGLSDEALADVQDEQDANTPDGAHRGDLAGTVARLVRLVELHVVDPDRLLSAAGATGFPTGHRDDVLAAARWWCEKVPDIPGVELVTVDTHAIALGPGDELYEWRDQPLVVTFGAGSRLRGPRPVGADGDEGVPDFAALFRTDQDDDEDALWQFTPRTADVLHAALGLLADQAQEDIAENGAQPVGADEDAFGFFDRLPRMSWNQGLAWRPKMAAAADDLCNDLEAGRQPTPRCHAEELILHLAIADAADMTDDEVTTEAAHHRRLPSHPDDYDWDGCSEILFEDHDVLLLYDEQFDGVEDPDTELNQQFRIGDLRPANWFTPIHGQAPRTPGSGVDR